jgi:protein O-mannosyl-transferase
MPKPGRPHKTPARLALIIPIALVSALALVTYFNALSAPFVWDDDPAIVTNQSIRGPLADSLVPPIETPVAGRPIVNASLAINYGIGGLDTTGYHIFNLAVHAAAALLLFGIVRRTFHRRSGRLQPADRPPEGGRHIDGVALVAALIWMVHPLLSETVDYVTQRSESMMGLFFLLTLYAAIRASRAEARDSSQRERRRARRWELVSIGACAIGMATKESMVTAPIAVVLYDLVFEFDSVRDAVAARRFLYIGLAATWLELGLIMWRWPRSTVGASAVGGSPVGGWTYLLNQAQMIVRYLGLTIWPQSLVVDYGLPRMLAFRDVIVEVALLVFLVAATALALRRWPAVGFLGLMFFLTLAPTSSIVPITTEVGAERRMYLPLAALVVLVVTLAGVLVERARTRSPGLARTLVGAAIAVSLGVIAALAVRTAFRNQEYETPLALWESVVARRPQGRARFALANQLIDADRHSEAVAQLREAVADFPDARAGLGTELLVAGEVEEGVAVLETFVQDNPSLPNRAPARPLIANGYRALAERSLRQQQAVLAAEQARKSLQFEPQNADAHNLLGAALASQGQLDQAIVEFQAALRINPQHQQAANNLSRAAAIMRDRK